MLLTCAGSGKQAALQNSAARVCVLFRTDSVTLRDQSSHSWEDLQKSCAGYLALAPLRSLNWTIMDFRILFRAWPKWVSL